MTPLPDKAVDKSDQELQDQIVALRSTSKEFVSLLQSLKLPAPVLTQLQKFLDNVSAMPGQVVDLLMSTIESSLDEKVMILEAVDLKDRISKAIELLTRQIHVSRIGMDVDLWFVADQNVLIQFCHLLANRCRCSKSHKRSTIMSKENSTRSSASSIFANRWRLSRRSWVRRMLERTTR